MSAIEQAPVTIDASDPEVLHVPRPLQLIPELPAADLRNAFRRKLERRGLTRECAAAVARAVVDPAAADILLENPTSHRVPGAELQVIRVQVYTTRVMADATNPRTLNKIPFPAARIPGADQTTRFSPIRPPGATGSDEFTLKIESIDQLIWQLDATMHEARRDNVPRPPIALQGIMEPPLAVPASIELLGGGRVGGAVLIREGSTRISHAQAILGVAARDLLLEYVDDRAQRKFIDSLNGLAQSSASSLTEEHQARIRVATLPLDLVVGVTPDPERHVTLADAVAAKVAQDHLNHKKEWDAAAKDVHLGETCLIALRDEGLLSDEKYAWLAGRLPADHGVVDGVPIVEDDRWAELLWLFTTRKQPYAGVIRRPIATVLERDEGRSAVRNRNDRVPLAIALTMRSRRGAITETAAEKESKLLEAAVPAVVWQNAWSLSAKSIDDLAAAAAAAASERRMTPEGTELAVRAIWYLAKHGQLAMPRNDLGPGGDRRSPADLTTGMLESGRGVLQLARAVEDGRKGQHAGTVVDDQGRIDVSGIGTPVPLRDETVRAALVPRSGPPAPPPRNPNEEFLDAVAALTRRLRDVVQADEDLRAVDDGRGNLLHERIGLMPPRVEEMRDMLTSLSDHVDGYERAWRVAEAIKQAR